MQTIAIDMDETIADPMTKARDWYFRDHGARFTDEELHGRTLADVIPEQHKGTIHKYLNTPGFFRDLKTFPNAVEVIEQLNKKYKVYIVSAAMEFPTSLIDKYEWLQETLPFLTWRQYCLCGDKSIVQTDFMIDDLTRNFSNFKGKAYLYHGHHNVHMEGYERVQDWADVAKKLL